MSSCDAMQESEIIMTLEVCVESDIRGTIDGNIGWYSTKLMKEHRMTHLIYPINDNTSWINLNFSNQDFSMIHKAIKSVITPT